MQGLTKTAWMGAVVVGIWGISQPRPAGAQSATAVLPAPAPLSERLTPFSEGTWKIVTSNTVHGLEYRIDAINADVPALLKALGEASHTRFIVSDDVHARLSHFRNAGDPVATIINRIATAAGLAVGKVGTDTYLVVNAPPAVERVPLIIAPYATPFQPYAPRVEPVPMPGSQSKADPHRGWSPRTFNGMTYYMIPLGQGATAPTVAPTPELPDLTASLLHKSTPPASPTLLNPGAITPAK